MLLDDEEKSNSLLEGRSAYQWFSSIPSLDKYFWVSIAARASRQPQAFKAEQDRYGPFFQKINASSPGCWVYVWIPLLMEVWNTIK